MGSSNLSMESNSFGEVGNWPVTSFIPPMKTSLVNSMHISTFLGSSEKEPMVHPPLPDTGVSPALLVGRRDTSHFLNSSGGRDSFKGGYWKSPPWNIATSCAWAAASNSE